MPSPPLASNRLRTAARKVSERIDELERRPLLGFPIASYRRFKEIDGKQLAFVIGGNLFVAVIPLFIVGYAIIEAFNPNRSVAALIIQRFRLSGDTANLVRQTFSNARSGRNVALSIGVISLLVTGFDVATKVQTAYARAFRVTPMRGVEKLVRGGAWVTLMLTVTAIGFTIRYWAQSRPWWFSVVTLPVLVGAYFVFFLGTPRLLLHRHFEWRHLAPGAAVCVVAYGIFSGVSVFLLRRWVSTYGHGYGGFGVALAFLAWVGILATFWVWIAAIAGIYWERFEGAGDVAAVEETSAGADS